MQELKQLVFLFVKYKENFVVKLLSLTSVSFQLHSSSSSNQSVVQRGPSFHKSWSQSALVYKRNEPDRLKFILREHLPICSSKPQLDVTGGAHWRETSTEALRRSASDAGGELRSARESEPPQALSALLELLNGKRF